MKIAWLDLSFSVIVKSFAFGLMFHLSEAHAEGPKLMTIKDPAQMEWDEIRKIDHYALSVKDLAK